MLTSRLALAVILIVAGIGVGTADENYGLHVTGNGVVTVAPDSVKIRVKVSASGAFVAPLKVDVDGRSNAVVRLLSSLSVPDTDYQAAGLDIERTRNYETGELGPYLVGREIEVTLHDLEKYASFVDGVIEAGVTEVTVVEFFADDPEETLANRALAAAIENATAKASYMARTSGVSLGKMLSLQEGRETSTVYNFYSEPEPEARFIPSRIEKRATVRMIFELE